MLILYSVGFFVTKEMLRAQLFNQLDSSCYKALDQLEEHSSIHTYVCGIIQTETKASIAGVGLFIAFNCVKFPY